MTKINVLFDFESDEAAERAAQVIEERLERLDMVETVRSRPLQMRITGLELVAAVGVTVALVRGSREVVEELPKLLKAIRAVMEEFRDLRSAWVDIGRRRVAIEKLEVDDLAQLAQ